MLNYRFLLNNKDITKDVLEFSYNESLDDVASSFSFTSLENLGLTSVVNGQEVLNKISIFDGNATKPFYVGYITDYEHTTDVNKYSYNGFDVGFYLNKNEVIKQFKNLNIGDAIISLCREFQIDLTNSALPKFTQSVSKIYKDVILGDILKELLELEKTKGGIKNIYIDCKSGNLQILKYQIEQNLSAFIANNILINSDSTINNVSVKHSIQELKNRVIYTDNDEKSLYRKTASDTKSIKTYGLLTSIESVDTKKNNNLTKLAKDKLNELKEKSKEISLSLLSDYKLSKGKVIKLNIGDYKLQGTYLVKTAWHTIDSQKEVVSISIGEIVL